MKHYLVLGFGIACEKSEGFENGKDETNEVNDKYVETRRWFERLCSPSLGGRYSGSQGIRIAKNSICDVIGRNDSLICDLFETPKCEMTNIIFHVEGKSDSLIVLGAHYDAYGYNDKTPLPGAEDNLSGVTVLLNVIHSIKNDTLRPHYSIDICFFDGEEVGRYGSRHYVTKLKHGVKLFINVDTVGDDDYGLTLSYSGYNYDMLKDLQLIKKSLDMNVVEYDPVGYTTDCDPFLIQKIPFVMIIDNIIPNYLHSPKDDISHISFSRLERISNSLYAFLATI